MSLPLAAPLRSDDTDHEFDRLVTFKGGSQLYVSTIPTKDRHVETYDVSIFPVTFMVPPKGETDPVREEVTHVVSQFLNIRSARFRKEVMGSPQRFGARSLRTYLDAGVIYAHRPIVNERLQLCFVPVPALRDSVVKVHPLDPLRRFGVIKTIQ